MEYNLAGIREQVLVDKLDDDEFEPSVVDNFINHTQRDIFNSFELPFMEKIFSGSIPTGAIIFTQPEDMALAQSRVITSPDGKQSDMERGYLDFRTFNKMYPTPANNTPGPVHHWTSYAGNILTSCPTDQDYTMTVYYVKRPTKLQQDTDVPEIPEEFEELLILGAFMRIQKRNEDFDLSRETENEFYTKLTNMVDRYGLRTAGTPIKMKNMQR